MFDYIVENSTNANMIFERNGSGRTPMEIAAGSSRLIDMAKHIVDLVKGMNILKQFPMSDDEEKRFLLSGVDLRGVCTIPKSSEVLSYILENFRLFKDSGNTFSTALPFELEKILLDAMYHDYVQTIKVLLRYIPPSNVKRVTLSALEDVFNHVQWDRVWKLLIPYCADVIFQEKWRATIFNQQQSRFLQRVYIAMNQPDAYSQFGCIHNNNKSAVISSLGFDRMRMFLSSEIVFLRTVYLCANHNPRLAALRLDKRLLMYLTFWGIYMYL